MLHGNSTILAGVVGSVDWICALPYAEEEEEEEEGADRSGVK
jgi:hypothetical protein